MCAICHSAPCHPRCPNAPEPIAIDDCYLCDIPILEGEGYFTVGSVAVCNSCVMNISMAQLKELTDMTADEILCELGGEEKVGEAY